MLDYESLNLISSFASKARKTIGPVKTKSLIEDPTYLEETIKKVELSENPELIILANELSRILQENQSDKTSQKQYRLPKSEFGVTR